MQSNLFHLSPQIDLIIALVLYILIVWKLSEMTRGILWFFGFFGGDPKQYRKEVYPILKEQITKGKIDLRALADIDNKFNFPYPWLWKKDRHGFLKVLKFIFRQPYLVVIISFHLMAIKHDDWVTVVDTILIALLIFVELLNFLTARGKLGFIDNFRVDFKKNPKVSTIDKNETWSKTDLMARYAFGMTVYVGSSIIGFAAMYFSTYTLNYACFNGNIENKYAQFQLLYFSIITAATVGYGDISPCCCYSEIIASSEAVFSFAIIGILLFAVSNTFSFDDNFK